jgi:hypothetical protein
MNYTILSAQWGNAAQTAAIIVTAENGAVAISAVDTIKEWQDFQTWIKTNTIQPLPPVTPPTKQDKILKFFNNLGITPAEFKVALG